MFLFLCLLAGYRPPVYPFAFVPTFVGRNGGCSDPLPQKESQGQHAPDALSLGRRLSSADSLSFPAVFSIEAAFVFSFILMILSGIMLLALRRMQEVEEIARSLRDAPKRYTTGLRAEDLIRIGAFIREWIPPKP